MARRPASRACSPGAHPFRTVRRWITRRCCTGSTPRSCDAVTSPAGPLAIIAAAGSGKTTVLTRRIAYRIATGAAAANHTLALTFTRDAAGELRRRLRALDLRERIEAGTFHSVALRLLRDRALARHETAPRVATDRLRLMRECLTEVRLDISPSFAMADLDWARARLVTPEQYEETSRRARRSAVPPARFADLAGAYERLKKRRGVVDFDDLLERVVTAVNTDPVFAEVVRWRFRHLYVDEAQDLNPLQHALLEAWRGGRPDVCLVGDPRQAIYGWNGAERTNLTEVEVRYPGVTVISLTTNHRCTPQVVRAGAAALAAGGYVDDTASSRPDGPAVQVQQFADEANEAAGVVRIVVDALGRHGPGQIGVLARTNEQLGLLDRELDRGRRHHRARRRPIDARRRTRRGLPRRRPRAAGAAGWTRRWAAATRSAGRVAEEADRFLTSGESGGFRSWVASRNPFDDLAVPQLEAVALLTFHAAKGREWATVVVTGVEDGLVPHGSASNAAQRAEESRLLYVALTRAQRELVVTVAAQRNNRPVAPSPWLEGVRDAGLSDLPVAPPARWSGPRAAPDPLSAVRAWRTAVARAAGVPDGAVCNERVLRSLHDDPPPTTDELATRLGVSVSAAAPAAAAARTCFISSNTSWPTAMNRPVAWAHSRPSSATTSSAEVNVLRPSTRSMRPRKCSSRCSGVGER